MRKLIAPLVLGAFLFSGIAEANVSPKKHNAPLVVDSITLNGAPVYTGTITFDVTTDTELPWVELLCLQPPTPDWPSGLAFGQVKGFFPDYFGDQNFTLGPTQRWDPTLPADCTATLFRQDGNNRVSLATTTFTVPAA